MNFIRKYIFYMDKVSDRTGKIASWIIVPLVLGTVYDVVMRYFFQAPTVWAYEMTWMEYGALFMLGGGYALLHKLHVRVDVVFKNYPEKAKLWFDAVMYMVVFIPLFIILIISSIDFAKEAIECWEVSSNSVWQPYIWPIKTIIPLAFILMFLQGIAEVFKILKELNVLKGGDAI
jgi:TRAP-type mannitol/chloroaromatic compound transport system permease small subunit